MFYCIIALATSALVEAHQEKAFLNWMRTNNKYFTGNEYHLRLGIYLANSRYVQLHNKANKDFKVSLNKFSVYTPSEYRSLLNQHSKILSTKRQNLRQIQPNKQDWPTPPDELDWREKGGVSEIGDQGNNCASGWAFAVAAGCEGCWFLNKAELLKFSPQNFIDCINTCYGCEGGLVDDALTYIIINQGGQFNLESDYPYTGTEGNCQFDFSKAVGGIKGWVHPKKEKELLEFVAHYGPTATTMDASAMSFSLYTSGIYSETDTCNPLSINHGICLVGYGTEDGVNYWIGKNSFGKNWGEDGFIRMIRDRDICGIAVSPYSAYYDIY